MFNLTTIGARTNTANSSSLKTKAKIVAPSPKRTVEAKGPFSKQISSLENSITRFEKKNAELSDTINRLIGAMTTMKERKELFTEFENNLRQVSLRLDTRYENLLVCEEQVKSFRQTPDTPDYSQYKYYEQKKRARSSADRYKLSNNEADDPILTRPRMVNKTSQEHQDLLEKNKELVEIALAQERRMLLGKMKLRLCHDHRDLSQLRRVLNKLEGGGETFMEEERITNSLKVAISNLRAAIARERERIRIEKLPSIELFDAAVIIQKTWRGYRYRQLNNIKKDKSDDIIIRTNSPNPEGEEPAESQENQEA